jgi:hypothetical protein
MYLTTLPVVPVRPGTGQPPESGTLTSVFLPMLAEKGFGVSVRYNNGEYLQDFYTRIEALCSTEAVEKALGNHRIQSLLSFQVRPSAALRQDPPTKEKITSDHLVSVHTRADLLKLLEIKAELDLSWVGLPMTDCKRTMFLPKHGPYLQMIHGLEEMGVLRGIGYEYDVWYESHMPPYADVRTLYVDRYRILSKPRSHREARDEVMDCLEVGCKIDADAVPLRRFFEKAYKLDDPVHIKKVKYDTRPAAGRAIGRRHDLGQVTVVKTY